MLSQFWSRALLFVVYSLDHQENLGATPEHDENLHFNKIKCLTCLLKFEEHESREPS